MMGFGRWHPMGGFGRYETPDVILWNFMR